MERSSTVKRKTSETDISLKLVLDSSIKSEINSGVPFFDHMLNSMSKHGHFYLKLDCLGDYEIDDHHTVEDVGICLGMAFSEALGDKAGIYRFGDITLPMDETLTLCAIDLSGRSFFKYSGVDLKGYIGRYSEELTLEFLHAFVFNASINLHVRVIEGVNKHHIHESIFKSLGVALYRAFSFDKSFEGIIPSTKGKI